MNKKLWIVGKNPGNNQWEFQGIFSTEGLAVAACRNENYFVAPAIIDEPFPDETHEWPGAYYPQLSTAPN